MRRFFDAAAHSKSAHCISLGGNYDDRNFLFFPLPLPLIDAIVPGGIPSRQIR
jgi:hypothetical protein